MRLTLRTMLAYLDELLEPADRDDVGKKIADSPFAANLIERIRNRIGNPRLGTPKLSGRGMGVDPNTVAEYLDNTLAAERVPEFEKTCLPPADAGQDLVESDVHLAEVAACHQILAMVLGQPAHVDPQMKRRMYGIINQVPPPVSEVQRVAGSDELGLESDDMHVRPARHRPEIPDYLRDRGTKSSWKPIIAAIVLFALLVGAITMALGPIDQLLGLNQPAKNQPENGKADGGKADGENAAKEQPAANTEQPGKTEVPTAPTENGNAAAGAGTAAPANTVGERYTNPPMPDQGAAPAAASTTPAAPDAHPQAIENPSPLGSASPAPPPSPNSAMSGATNPPPLPVPAANSNVAPTTPNRTGVSHIGPPATDATPPNPAAEPHAVGPPPLPGIDETPLGRFVPGKDVLLLKFDAGTGHWARLPDGSSLSGGDQLLVLPNYRPTITLTVGITLQLLPETQLTLVAPDADGVPTVKISYGRLVALTTGKAGAKLKIDVGANGGVVTFTDADATLGVDVKRYFLAGINPEQVEPRVAADLYAASGHMDWVGRDGSMATLSAPQRWPLTQPMPDTPVIEVNSPSKLPKWIAGESSNSIFNRPSATLIESLDAGKPLLIALQEMTNSRRVEAAAFSAVCLAMLDQFDSLIKTFADPDQHALWPVEIASIKAALARSPATAAAVRDAFQKQRSDEPGKDLYRMFLGYTKDQLQAGEAARLVDFLDHDNLDFRMLAYTNLYDITKATHNYRPEANDQARKVPMRNWQEALKQGKIVPAEAPARP